MRHKLYLALMFLFSLHGYAQEWNSARLVILYGGNITFNFNNLSKIKEGIELTEATHLGISLADSNQAGHTLEGFELNFRTFNGATQITGDVYTHELNTIRVKAENALGLASGTSYGYQNLDVGWTTLFSYTNPSFTDLTWDSDQIYLSYDCGIPLINGGNGSLLGKPGDYYTIEIEIELIPTGPGF
jgi:hypothetical protein